MKTFRFADLDPQTTEHVLTGLIPGSHLSHGGIGFKKPGHRSHDGDCTCKSCDGKGRHVHADDHEVFLILQGKGTIQINGVDHEVRAGDVVVCEPGEDHHLVADTEDPLVNVYLHAGNVPHWRKETGK